MDGLESIRSYVKRDAEDSSEMKLDRADDEDDWDGVDKKRHRSSRSRSSRHGNGDDRDEWEKRKGFGDRNDARKRSSGSGRAESGDDNDYDTRKESTAKTVKKSQEERSEKKSSSGYHDRDMESRKICSRDVDVSKYMHAEENDRNSSRKTNSKPSLHESSQSKTRTKVDASHDNERETSRDKDSRHPERKENNRDKGSGTHEQERSARRRWDEPDSVRKAEESNYLNKSDSRSGKPPDHKHGSSRERNLDARIETSESKNRAVDLNTERGLKSSSHREEKRVDADRSKNRSRSEFREEDRTFTNVREDKVDVTRDDKHRARDKWGGSIDDMESNTGRMGFKESKNENLRQPREHARVGRGDGESRERSSNADEDARLRERSGREIRRAKRSRSPERSGRHRQYSDEFERGFSESDNERSNVTRGKERDKENYKDDRSKARDNNWDDRNRDWEVSKDNWRRRHQIRHDKETKDGDGDYEYEKEWDSQRHERERVDSDKVHGRSNYRKERSREGAKTSSSYGTMNEKSDAIEVRPKPLDFGREEAAKRPEMGMHQDFTSATSDEDWGHMHENRPRVGDVYGTGDDMQEPYLDDDNLGTSSGRNNFDLQGARGRGQKGNMNSNRSASGRTSGNGLLPLFGNNQGSGSFNRVAPQGSKVGRLGRGGRGRLTGRDGRVNIPLPILGPPPFGHLGLPPGPMQPIGPNMSPAPGPAIAPGVFIPPFPGPMVWPGARGVEMSMLAVQPGLSPVPPSGPAGPRFAPNVGNGANLNPAMYFNQPGPIRGVSPGPGYNGMGPVGHGVPHEKTSGGWGPPRISGPAGKAPSRGEQNDYSQNFVDTGMRPQNFIRELELTSIVEDYPKLRELIQKKDEIVAKSASPPMYFKCDLHEHALSPEFFGTKFDVILVDPPWEEYVHRAPGVTDQMEYWNFEEIQNLKIEMIADTPSFIFLWVGDGVGLEQGRQCLKKWGFRRCEDICWVKTNKTNATPGLRHDSHTLFQHSKEHCLMGIKGTVRRSTDGHIIHANIDTDIIIAEEPPYGSTKKPDDLYRIIEHFSLGRRRLELFGEDHNIRSGWLTVGKGLSSSNFNAEAYVRNFADKDGKVWQGGGGRNPPPDAPHLVLTTPDIESLRPKSPPQKNQQQQSSSISLMTTANSAGSKWPVVNSPQNVNASSSLGVNQEASGSNPATPVPWAASPLGGGPKGPDVVSVASEDKYLEGFGVNASCGQTSGDPSMDFDPHRAVGLL